ncbi:SDR family NAD(P)-dependent oxidoreductase [Seohaeicola nanhaiensis]|uniref:SDR family NAD(P)-dependent oxidoreductase n=1 Tax=Seohaeicola nanhaiensis TaxID=1387282 RepID=A0ABV9KFV3_9RHOB
MSFSIAGKTAIVTGSANGIGLAIGRTFAAKGANVMFVDADEKALVAELGEQPEDGNIRWFAGDLRERLTIANLVSATLDSFDQIDILINGARQITLADPLDSEDDTVLASLQLNLLPALRLSQVVARRMIKQSEGQTEGSAGTIVNLTSIAARRTHADMMAYSVATAALDQSTRSLALALAPHRIRVNGLALGSVMSASLMQVLKDNREYRARIESFTPMGRIAAAAEVTEAAQFLASDASGFMTGQILTLDGGRTLLDPVAAPTPPA